MLSLDEIIEELKLEPLVGEGGMVSQPYISNLDIEIDGYSKRPITATIYYLLTPKSFSCMHKLKTDETWYYHYGPALQMLLIYPDGHSEIKKLGMDLKNGQQPQITIPKEVWQGTCMLEDGEFTLVSTQMAPRYMDDDYQSATYKQLEPMVDDKHKELLKRLTSELVYK